MKFTRICSPAIRNDRQAIIGNGRKAGGTAGDPADGRLCSGRLSGFLTGAARRVRAAASTLCAAAVFCTASLTSPASESTAAQRPNVIVILTDDQGYANLGCHGNPWIKTPNLDRLHAESVRLDNFHVAPTCSPTRAMLMTGRNHNRVGVWHTIMGRSILDRNEVTMAEIFRDNGYHTGIFGKWHLGDNYPYRPQDRGFDEVLVHGGGGVGNIQDAWGNDYFDDTYLRNGRPEKFHGFCTAVWFNEAISFVRANKERPFFLYIATNAPHQPYVAPPEYVKPYTEQGIEPGRAEFYAMITHIDEYVGRLREALRECQLDRNTLLIFASDNGTSRGERNFNAGMRGMKASPYEGGHRVPFFLHWPAAGLTSGRDVSELTFGADVLPTLMELCGLQRRNGPPLDGRSLVPLLRGEKAAWTSDRVLFTDSQRTEFPEPWRMTAVMKDRWRLINGIELYDLATDPGQRTNIALQQPALVAELRQAYDEWWRSLQPSFDHEPAIVIGSERANPVLLTTHDLHGRVTWNQDEVLAARRNEGYWALEVERDGIYEVCLRRWPPEVDAPITASIPVPASLKAFRYFNRSYDYAETHDVSASIVATYARLRVGSYDRSSRIAEGAREVRFRVPLSTGPARLQATFVNGADIGEVIGAYYVSITRIGNR